MKNGNKSQFKVLFGGLPQVCGYLGRQEVGQVLFGDYACMHAVLCCAVHTIYFHLFHSVSAV